MPKLSKGPTTAYRGVTWSTVAKKWLARITVNGKTKTLGHFTDEHAAARAYNAALIDRLKRHWNVVPGGQEIYIKTSC